MKLRKKKTLVSQIIKDFHKHKPFLQKLIECCNPNKSKKKRKVNETPMRSFLKAIGFRIVEVILDSLLLTLINPSIEENILASIGIEALCFGLSFIWERLWNLTDFGREVKAECPHCKKEMEMCAECETKTTTKRKSQKRQ